MHNHNNDDKGMKAMMWMMVICCALLLAFLVFGGTALLSFSGGYLVPIIIGVFVIAHIWMMFKGHGGHGGESHGSHDKDAASDGGEVKSPAKQKDDHSCCH